MFNKNYARYYDLFNRSKDYKGEIEFIYEWAEKPKLITDLGCGTANYWQYYPEDVFIRGLEISKDMIDQSRYKNKILNGNILNFDWDKFKVKGDLVTALFDVINYVPEHKWWKDIPLEKGGYFIFDIWDKKKIDKEGFRMTKKTVDKKIRIIYPGLYRMGFAELDILVKDAGVEMRERHRLYIWDDDDIERFAGVYFDIVEIKPTKTWQKWYKLKRK